MTTLKQVNILPDLQAKNDKILRRVCQAVGKLPANPSVRQLLTTFEDIEGFLHKRTRWNGASMTWGEMKKLKYSAPISDMSYLQEYVQIYHLDLYARLHRFFKQYCAAARKTILKSPELEACLKHLAAEFFLKVNKQDARRWELYQHTPFNIELAREAYQHVLDQYDCNVSEDSWSGFWSLASFRNGKLVGVYLGDTEDVEDFWAYIRQKQVKRKTQ